MFGFRKFTKSASILSVFILMLNLFSGLIVYASEKNLSESSGAQEILDIISQELPRISEDGTSVILPDSPDPGYEISLYGSDNKQIIDMELNYFQPISDMNVNILYKVSNKTDPTDYAVSTKDIPVRVKGQYNMEKGDNKVPNVIPGLREWKGHTGNFTLTSDSKLIVEKKDADHLTETAKLIQVYFQNMLGKEIAIVEGTEAGAGNIFLTLDTREQHLGDEGYTLDIADSIIVRAPSEKGINYGGISLTQILYQSEDKNIIPKGLARDYPKYEVRSGMLDVGRMYIPLDYVEEMAQYMAWFKLNEIQMHINDYWGSANYEAFRVESKKFPEINAKDGYYPQEEYIAFQNNMKKYGVDVVTEIDTPYHAESFRPVNPEMMLKKGALDITTKEKRDIVYPFIESLFDEFLGNGPNDENRIVQGGKFHIGTDEYDKNYSEQMRHYTDHFINYVNDKGYETRLWGSIGKNGFDGDTPVSNQATMNIWAPYWSDVQEMFDLGYDIINTAGGDLYIVPLGNAGYPDYLDIKDKYDSWEVNNFWSANRQGGLGGATMPFAHPQTKGAEFAVWNDMTSFTGGLSSYDIFNRMKDAVMLVSEKTWYGEKTEGQTSAQFMQRVDAVQGKTPLSNPTRHVETKSDIILKYDFESVKGNQVNDVSGNDYHATFTNGGIVEENGGNVFKLDGESYLEIPIKSIGYPYSVSFDIKLDKGSLENATIFSGEDGAFYLNMDGTDKIGYHRNEKTSKGSLGKFENYTFAHDYSLKENEWQNVILIGDKQETTLYINGKKVSTSKQTNKLEGRTNDSSTFVLPLEEIGKGIKGEIDTLTLMNKALTNSLQRNLALGQKATASSEYNDSQRAALVTDGNLGTRWGSQYRNITEEEKDNQWLMVELDDSYEVDEVKLHWETARAKAYKLLISNDGENFEEVYTHQYNASHGKLDSIPLDNIEAKYLKVVMSQRTTTYGYSMFEFEVFGKSGFSHGGKLVDEADELLANIPAESSGENERNRLIAAKDEMKSFLEKKQDDVFTFDILTRQLDAALETFKKTIVHPKNLAHNQRATASSEYNDTQRAAFVTDNDMSTRWGSQYKGISEDEINNQWIMVELDEVMAVDTLKLHWETARPGKYELLVSKDGKTFENIYTHTHDPKKGLLDIVNLRNLEAKFLKIAMTERTTKYGYSMYEFEVYDFREANTLIDYANELLNIIPENSSVEAARISLVDGMEKMMSYIEGHNMDGITYHKIKHNLETSINDFKQSFVSSQINDLDQDILKAYEQGLISNHGIVNSLLAKVEQIQKNQADYKKILNGLDALDNQVQAQSGKKIDVAYAEQLLDRIALLMNMIEG